jgi:hypothetical protein
MGGAAVLGLALLWLVQPARAGINFQVFSNGKSLDGKGGQNLDGFSVGEFTAHPGFFLVTEMVDSAGGPVTVGTYNTFTGVKSAGWNTDSRVTVSSFTGDGKKLTFTATIDKYAFSWTATSNEDSSHSKATPLNMGIVTVSGSVTPNSGASNKLFLFTMNDGTFGSPEGPPLYMKGTVFGNLGKGGAASIAAGDRVSVVGGFVPTGGGSEIDTNQATATHTTTLANTNTVKVTSGKDYQLRAISGDLELSGSGTTLFQTQAVTFMPEPEGIAMGLLGVPCVLGFLYFHLRRRNRIATVNG